ncbi:hypothetical protein D3C87_1630950 [compost metagenome]
MLGPTPTMGLFSNMRIDACHNCKRMPKDVSRLADVAKPWTSFEISCIRLLNVQMAAALATSATQTAKAQYTLWRRFQLRRPSRNTSPKMGSSIQLLRVSDIQVAMTDNTTTSSFTAVSRRGQRVAGPKPRDKSVMAPNNSVMFAKATAL